MALATAMSIKDLSRILSEIEQLKKQRSLTRDRVEIQEIDAQIQVRETQTDELKHTFNI